MRLIGSILVVKNRGSIATLPGASVHRATVAAMEPPLVSGIGGSAASFSLPKCDHTAWCGATLRRVPEAEKRLDTVCGPRPARAVGGYDVAALCRIYGSRERRKRTHLNTPPPAVSGGSILWGLVLGPERGGSTNC
jgi:hypothetical protein